MTLMDEKTKQQVRERLAETLSGPPATRHGPPDPAWWRRLPDV